MTDRRDEAREAIERVISEYADAFTENVRIPVLVDWVLVVAHDDAADPNEGGTYRVSRRYQSTYRSAGLLLMAADSYRGIIRDE